MDPTQIFKSTYLTFITKKSVKRSFKAREKTFFLSFFENFMLMLHQFIILRLDSEPDLASQKSPNPTDPDLAGQESHNPSDPDPQSWLTHFPC